MSLHRLVKGNLKRVRKHQYKALTPLFRRHRDVFARASLMKGKYTIVPMTLEQRVAGSYWFSIYYDHSSLQITQGPPCSTDEELADMTKNVNAELDQELIEAPEPDLDPEDRMRLGLVALSKTITELWVLAKELEQRKLILEEALERRAIPSVGSSSGSKGSSSLSRPPTKE